MNEYRVGIIGLSWITSEPRRPGTSPVLGEAVPHSHLSALAAIPGVTVVAGCDIVPAACERFLENWRGTWPGAKAYTDHREMLQAHDFDVVCVATPDNLHGEIVREVAATGVKGIFCEKPISHEISDADAMIAAIEQHGVVMTVNNTRRWMPPYVAAREAIRAGAIGRLSQIAINFGGERAMLWRNHAHFLDLCSYFAEGSPEWAMAELEPEFENYGTTYKGDGGRSPELEPGVNAYIAYENGVRAFLSGWKSSTQQITVDLYGAEGRIHANDQLAELVKPSGQGLATTRIEPAGSIRGMQAAFADLFTAIKTGGEVQSPPSEARKTPALIRAILESQAGGNVRVPVR